MQQAINQLCGLFNGTLSPDDNVRKNAEAQLKAAEKSNGYSLALMQLISESTIHINTRQSAAVALKNFVRASWEGEEIPENDRNQIKANVVNLMLSTSGPVQQQLSELIYIICEHDFHQKWPDLLPELVQKLKTNDFNTIRNVLFTAHSIFKKYRDQSLTDEIEAELIFIMSQFAGPMLELFKSFYGTLNSPFAQQEQAIKLIFECINLLLEIFYSLNWAELPEFFEDNMKVYFDMFLNMLAYSNRLVETDPDDDESGLLDNTKTLIVEIINLYQEKYSEQFDEYVPKFIPAVWTLLSKTTLSVKYDQFVSKALEFLTTISKSTQHQQFFNDQNIQSICENIIIPNVVLRDEDVEMFEDDPVEYIRRDIEGSDTDTRRRSASELIKGLSVLYEDKVTDIFVGKIGALLNTAKQDWKSLDVAIYLLSAIAVRGQTRGKGATQVNPRAPVNDLLQNHIIPQLNSDVNALPVIKADGIKFICLFRQHLPKSEFTFIFPLLMNSLKSSSRVVRTYAAWSIEKILTVKDFNESGKSFYRYTKEDVSKFTDSLFSLFNALQLDSTENEYIMKAVMRVTAVMQDAITPLIGSYLNQLSKILEQVCKNPRNPLFNHYIFESYATVIKFNPQFVDSFEQALWEIFNFILSSDLPEFTPYVFQIMSQMLSLHSGTIPERYMKLLPLFLDNNLWLNDGNIPGLTSLIVEFLKKDKIEIIKPHNLESVLGKFKKLISMKTQDHNGFHIVDAVVLHAPSDIISVYLPKMFVLMFSRLQTKKTGKFLKLLAIFFSLFSVKIGVAQLISVIESIQKGLFVQILKHAWLQGIHKQVSGRIERKTVSVALTRLLFDQQFMQAPEYAELFGEVLRELCKFLEQVADNAVVEEAEETNAPTVIQEESGYKVAYAQLSFAAKSIEDPVPDVQDAKIYLAQVIHSSITNNQQLKNLFVHTVNQQQLQQVISSYFLRANIDL